jgi:SPP1 family predicted phage head-tail adaptor
MRNGSARHKIEFVTIGETQDELGGVTLTETHKGYAMAEIKPISGGERFISNQVFTDASSVIKCRCVIGITTKHKVFFGDRRFDILNVQNKDERNIELIIVAKELF